MRRAECLDAVTSVLKESGIAYTIERGGKHLRVRYWVGDRRCVATVSLSPSDRRAAFNVRTQTRRSIREAGARI